MSLSNLLNNGFEICHLEVMGNRAIVIFANKNFIWSEHTNDLVLESGDLDLISKIPSVRWNREPLTRDSKWAGLHLKRS